MSEVVAKQAVQEHFDKISKEYDYWKKKNYYYYDTIKEFVRRIIPPGNKVLEVGCGTGDILAHVKPGTGVGVDISPEMVSIAAKKHPEYRFVAGAIEDLDLGEKFDYIIVVDVMDHVQDVHDVFKALFKLCHPATKIILTTINPWWDPVLDLAEKVGAKMPEGPHNFIEKRNLETMAEAADLKISYSGYLLLFPKYIPVFSYLVNSIGTRLWPLYKMSFVQYMIIQPGPENHNDLGLGCSVVIPCHNEEDNVQEAIKRVPQMGVYTEIIVVNDGSTDRTAEKVRELLPQYPNLKLIDYSPNKGKGHGVWSAFEAASQDVVMILDADMTTPPEELPRFFEPLNKGMCGFVNGTRMVYPMEGQAMRTLNLFGNKIFGLIMTFLIGQRISDNLCGTKALLKKDALTFQRGLDRWGDFDLLFGAAYRGLKILEVPVHYKERKAGVSKMQTLRHGLHLLTAVYKGFRNLIFK
jgi:ubiquinone/menaquinone biosynthesis C-methylase UbiE